MASRRTKGFWRRMRNWRFRQGNPSYGDPTDDTPERADEKEQERAAEREHEPQGSRPSQGGFDRPLGPLMGGPLGPMGGSG